MFKRIFKSPAQSFFLMGPRGSGKSTWLRNNFPDAFVIDLLSEEIYQHLLASPGHLADQLRAVPSDQWVIIDEIQRLPGLLNEVHRFIENNRLKFVLCGSSARKLKKEGINLLAGRAFQRAMHPFIPEERGALFEGMVAELLRAYKDYRSSFDEMYYWAPSSGTKTEVDFLLLKDDHFIAIEAKSGKKFSQSWCKGLRAIVKMKRVQRRIIVYPNGPVMRTEDGIDVIPYQAFADQLSRGLFA